MNARKIISAGVVGTSLFFSLTTSLRGSTDTLQKTNKSKEIFFENYAVFSLRKATAIKKIDKVLESVPTKDIQLLKRKIQVEGIKKVIKSRFPTDVDSMLLFGLMSFIVGLGFNELFLNKNKKEKHSKQRSLSYSNTI